MLPDPAVISIFWAFLFLFVLIAIFGNTASMIQLCRSGWPRTWPGVCYANIGGVNINDPDCNVTVGVMLGIRLFFSGLGHARDLN